jgi:hypothetical protein
MTATLSPEQERALLPFAAIMRKLKRQGVLTDVLVAASTSVNDLISDVRAALKSGTTALYPGEIEKEVDRFEQHIRHMENLGLITDVLVAALTTVLGASASTDLLYLMTGALSDTSLVTTTENSAGFESNYAYAVTR